MTRDRSAAHERESTRRDPAVVLIAHPDDAARTLLVENVLFFTNYRVVEAQSGRDAVERARRHGPKVVVLSTRLHELDCSATVRALRSEPSTRDARVIVLAAHDGAAAESHARECRGVELLPEPVSARELVERVKRAAMAPAAPSVRRAEAGRRVDMRRRA